MMASKTTPLPRESFRVVCDKRMNSKDKKDE